MTTRFNCNKCEDKHETVGQVRACGICTKDGTANEIPHDLAPATSLAVALAQKPGLGNRFTPIAASAPAPAAQAPVPPAPPAPPAPRKRAAKARAPRAPRRKKATRAVKSETRTKRRR